jgi:hypothetical protein
MKSIRAAIKTVEPLRHGLLWWSLAAVFYVILTIVLPANHATLNEYHLSIGEYRILKLVVSAPVLIVWFTAYWGYEKLRQYSQSISKTSEGEPFKQLSTGVAWLAWSLPATAYCSLILGSLARSQPALKGAGIIITDYVTLILPLIGFVIIGMAARGITKNVRVNFNLASARIIMFLFLLAGVAYCFLTLSHVDLASPGSTHNPYYMPVWLIVITIMVPSLYAWFTGLLAVYEITLFSKDVRGLLYRQALRHLVIGLILVIASLISVQYISGIQPRDYHFMLDLQLLATLVFRIIGGIGFIFMAMGADKLKKIEEV